MDDTFEVNIDEYINHLDEKEIVTQLTTHLLKWRQRSTGRYWCSPYDKKHLLVLARFAIRRKLNPYILFECLVEHQPAEHFKYYAFSPKTLLHKYNSYYARNNSELPVGDEFISNCQKLQDILNYNPSDDILLKTIYSFPAWFRIVISNEPDQKVINEYICDARIELNKNPKIKEFILSSPNLKDKFERFGYGV